MKLARKVGATSQIFQIFIADSSSTTGAGLTGLTSASSGLTAYYHRDTDTTATAISLVTMTVGTFTSSGFKEIDATNMPGWYQFCPPNAALASGAASVGFHLKGATNMAPLPIEVDLDSQVDVTFWNGTVVASPATAGIPDVNVKNINNVATTSVTTINANQGTSQPLNFTGTSTSALVKSDMVDIAGAAVSTSSAQIGVNAVNIGGTAQTGRDIGASVLLSAGTGTGQLDFTSGVVKANLAQILGTALTETSGQIAAAFKKFFNIATPASTMDALTLVATATTVTNRVTANTDQLAGQTVTAAAGVTFPTSVASPTNITAGTMTTTTNLTNAPTAGDFTATMKTSLNAATPASVVGAVGSVTGSVGSVTAAVAITSSTKINQALAGFQFLMTDATTHAPKTGLTITAQRSLNGAAFGSCANAASEIGNGWYTIDLNASDMNGKTVALKFNSAGADDADILIVTQP